MGFIKEFKEFAMKGNVMDMAVGVIIGGAFGKIVTSLVDHVIMPLVGLCTGGVNFNDMFVNFSDTPVASLAEATEKGVAVFAYGAFIQSVIDFLIIALCISSSRAICRGEASHRDSRCPEEQIIFNSFGPNNAGAGQKTGSRFRSVTSDVSVIYK